MSRSRAVSTLDTRVSLHGSWFLTQKVQNVHFIYITYVMYFLYIYICIIKEFDVSSNDWCIRKTQDNYPHSTFQFSVKGLLLELLELL